jgi:transposase-like protein
VKELVSLHPKSRRKFDQNFKKEAVDLWRQSGKSAEVVAAELGIRANRLYAWHKTFSKSAVPEGPPSVAELEKQNAALRRENEHLRQQRDILKKTLGILSEPLSNATNVSRP